MDIKCRSCRVCVFSLRKNLQGLLVVHPTLFLKTIMLMMKPFVRYICTKHSKYTFKMPGCCQIVLPRLCLQTSQNELFFIGNLILIYRWAKYKHPVVVSMFWTKYVGKICWQQWINGWMSRNSAHYHPNDSSKIENDNKRIYAMNGLSIFPWTVIVISYFLMHAWSSSYRHGVS